MEDTDVIERPFSVQPSSVCWVDVLRTHYDRLVTGLKLEFHPIIRYGILTEKEVQQILAISIEERDERNMLFMTLLLEKGEREHFRFLSYLTVTHQHNLVRLLRQSCYLDEHQPSKADEGSDEVGETRTVTDPAGQPRSLSWKPALLEMTVTLKEPQQSKSPAPSPGKKIRPLVTSKEDRKAYFTRLEQFFRASRLSIKHAMEDARDNIREELRNSQNFLENLNVCYDEAADDLSLLSQIVGKYQNELFVHLPSVKKDIEYLTFSVFGAVCSHIRYNAREITCQFQYFDLIAVQDLVDLMEGGQFVEKLYAALDLEESGERLRIPLVLATTADDFLYSRTRQGFLEHCPDLQRQLSDAVNSEEFAFENRHFAVCTEWLDACKQFSDGDTSAIPPPMQFPQGHAVSFDDVTALEPTKKRKMRNLLGGASFLLFGRSTKGRRMLVKNNQPIYLEVCIILMKSQSKDALSENRLQDAGMTTDNRREAGAEVSRTVWWLSSEGSARVCAAAALGRPPLRLADYNSCLPVSPDAPLLAWWRGSYGYLRVWL